MKLTYKATTSVEKTIKITKPKYKLNTEYFIQINTYLNYILFIRAYWSFDYHEWKYIYEYNGDRCEIKESEIKLINIK